MDCFVAALLAMMEPGCGPIVSLRQAAPCDRWLWVARSCWMALSI
jgi:hypothetical protein